LAIRAALGAAFGTLDALAVDNPRGGVPLPAFHLARMLSQVRVNLFPQLGVFPGAEAMLDRAPPGKVLRQIAPLAVGTHNVEQRVEQFPVSVLARTPGLAGLGKTNLVT
jgi:hypothetical protein